MGDQSSGVLGVWPHHEQQLLAFLRASRHGRDQRLVAITRCFDDTIAIRLQDSTFTKEEVKTLLSDLCQVVEAEVKNELINSAHTAMLLFRQMCGQAEQWQLKLYVNLSQLEDRTLLDAVQAFEDSQLQATTLREKSKLDVLKRVKLDNPDKITKEKLDTETQRLRAENRVMREQIASLMGVEAMSVTIGEDGVVVDSGGKTITKIQAPESGLNMEMKKGTTVSSAVGSDERTNEKSGVTMESSQMVFQTTSNKEDDKRLRELQAMIEQMRTNSNNDSAAGKQLTEEMQKQLTSAQERMMEIQSQLRSTEDELEKKFSQTNAYKNMKGMLTKKNSQMKDIRKRLRKYEPDEEEITED